jgi:basic amino acid/polyamine antiporter, APA family
MSSPPKLRREIRKWDLVALVLNCIIGAGIFGLPSRAFALAGTWSLLAYVVCAVPILLIVLCFAEVGSRFKETGGLYLYAREAFGSLIGFEMGWLAWLTRITAFAALCNLFVDYTAYFIPAAGAGLGRVMVITGVISCLAAVNVAGVGVASAAGNIFTIGKLLPLLLLVAIGSFFVNSENFASSAFPMYSSFSSSVLVLVFAFTGFEMAGIPAGEAKDPRRHLPFALLAGAGIAVLLYVAIQAVCIGTVPNLATSQRPLADAGAYIFGPGGAAVIALGALVSVLGTMNAIMLAGPRLLFAMAEQGQLSKVVATTHPRFHTPHVAILFTAAAVILLTLSGTFTSLATLSTIIRLATYAVTCAAVQVLRRRGTDAPGLFLIPGGKFVSTAALVLIAWLFSSSAWSEVAQTLIAIGIGLILYAAFARIAKKQELTFVD